MKQRIRLTESDIHKVVKSSIREVLNESYNNSQTVGKINDLRQNLLGFIEYLEDRYDTIGLDDDFLDRVYNSANKLEKDMHAFLYDDHQQSVYGY